MAARSNSVQSSRLRRGPSSKTRGFSWLCLQADLRIREQTHNHRSIDDAMRAILLYAGGVADSVLEGKAALPQVPVGEDEFVELDEEGNPMKRPAGATRRGPAPTRGKKPAPRRKVAVTVVPSVAAVAASLDEVEVDDVDAADTPPAETRPASAPRRRPVGRRTPARGA